MPKAPEVRNYNFPDADLKQKADQCLVDVNRDINDFTTRGITTATLTGFLQLTDAFNNLPTDDELTGALTTATEAKDGAAETLFHQTWDISDMVEVRVSEHDGVDRRSRNWEVLPVALSQFLQPLKQAAIEQHAGVAVRQEVFGPRDRAGGP